MDDLFQAVIFFLNIYHSRDGAIEQAIRHIHDSYSLKELKTVNATLVDYSRIEYQCAYIFLYFTSHVNFIHKLLDSFYEDETLVRNFFFKHRGSIRVCSLGGGPGSDIFGLNSFYKERFGNCNVFGDILDRHTSWNYIFVNLMNQIEADNLSDVSYESFDFLSNTSIETAKQYIKRANLVTLVKFISAVAYDRTSAENKLTNLLKSVKSGAIVFFVDNSQSGYLELMNRSATAANLQLISKIETRQFRISKTAYSNEKAILCEFSHRRSPQKCARVAASIWYKTETIIVSNSTGSNVNDTTNLPMSKKISPTIHAATQTTESTTFLKKSTQTNSAPVLHKNIQTQSTPFLHKYTQVEFTSFLDKSTQMESTPLLDKSTQMESTPLLDKSTQMEFKSLLHKYTRTADQESVAVFIDESETTQNSDPTSIENFFAKRKSWARFLSTMIKSFLIVVIFLFIIIIIILVN